MRIASLLPALVLATLTAELSAANLSDFGYGHMNVRGQPAVGPRPLVVLLVDFAGGGTNRLARNETYYDNLVFSLTSTQAINGFFLENSNSRFFWSRAGAGTIGPFYLSEAERSANIEAGLKVYEALFLSNVIAKVMLDGRFNFAAFDTTAPIGTVTQDELQVMIISNNGETGGSVRTAFAARAPGVPYVVDAGRVAIIDHRTGFSTIAHEFSHVLGTLDLYGVWNQECLSKDVTLMSCTSGTFEDFSAVHLDPMHKMWLGWSEPRIRDITLGGVETLPATQMRQPDAPVILYNPTRGPDEFFMLEYRTRNSPNGSGFDRSVADNGMALWRCRMNSSRTEPVTTPRVGTAPAPAQTLWRWCNKCEGLHYIANGDSPRLGACTATGMHDPGGSGSYTVIQNNPAPSRQSNWRWCRKCESLFFGGTPGFCPAGGAHDGSQSSDYSLTMDVPTEPGQHNWRWCRKCGALFYGPNQGSSNCAADRNAHDGSQSSDYTMYYEGENYVAFTLASPDFTRGGSALWGSGVTTPYLSWIDGGILPTRLEVRRFNPGDGWITVEWLTERNVWVDFAYTGLFEVGLFDFPYNTLVEGVAAAPHGGSVTMKTGSTSETGTISKRLFLNSYGGWVTLGR